MTAPDVARRPAREADTAFIARVYASTREDEVARMAFGDEERAAFVAQQFATQSAHYARHYGGASYDVVLVDGVEAGRLIVADLADEVLIVDVALLPAFRGRGVGTRLLAPILAEADAAGRSVGIHVERSNPARRLYERLGFVAGDDDGVYRKMERPPAVAVGAVADQPKTAW
jgi:ribosomal protein S18 acetylase RimI-like enzyme